jgi:SMODS and SLOG-associating 2TM effector domain 1
MSQRDDKQFLKLYQTYRYEDQLHFYRSRQTEFTTANAEGTAISIGLMFLAAAIGGIASSVTIPWLKLTCLLVAAICPILSTALAGYSVLYGFELQAKLYQDTINNLLKAHAHEPSLKQGLSNADFAQALNDYISEVENTFLVEQGQWGQVARKMKPSEI